MSDARTTAGTLADTPRSGVRVGVLSFHTSKETKAILNAVNALGHVPIWLREDNTRTWMEAGDLHLEPTVDVVVNRVLATKLSQPLDVLGVATGFETVRPVLNPPAAVTRAMHKFGAAATLAAVGIPVPDAYMAFEPRSMDPGQRPLEGPIVHKPAIGTNGHRMSLLENGAVASPRIAHRRAFLQEFLAPAPGRPFDVRVYVVDGRVIGAMKRYAPPDEWRTNVALGGDVEPFTDRLPGVAKEYALRATDALGLDYAGVDLLHRRGEWYVLEVNATAGFKGFFEATGVSPAPAIAKAAIQRVDGDLDEDAVDELAASLDDALPPCAPSRDPVEEGREIIGLTEQVTLAGEAGAEQVVAKVDTGAERTSLDLDVAAEVGAGSIVGTTRVKSGIGATEQKRPLVDVDLKLGSRWHTTTANLEDRSHMTYQVLLGRDVLDGYRIDIQRSVEEE